MRSTQPRTTAFVMALADIKKTFGVVEELTSGAARFGTSAPLTVGETVQVRIFVENQPTIGEREGRVVWSRWVANLGRLSAQSRIQWLTTGQACAPWRETQEGTAA